MRPAAVSVALLIVAANIAFLPGRALSHHSFAMFDMDNPITVTGTVKEWKWTNPHSWLYLIEKRPDDVAREWAFETSNSAVLIRRGWRKDTLKSGDVVTVSAFPSKDGAAVGNITTVTLPDGRVLDPRR